jgi:tyrosine-protein kinase Etk/Wzc
MNDWQMYMEEKENQSIMRILNSESLLQETVASLSWGANTLASLRVIAKSPKDSNLITIDVEDSDPKRMVPFVGKLLALGESRITQLLTKGYGTKVEYLRSQVAMVEQRIQEIDKKLQVFVQKEEVLHVGDKLQQYNEEIQRLKVERLQAEVEVGVIAEALLELKGKSKEMGTSTSRDTSVLSELIELRNVMIQLRKDRIRLISVYQEEHPEVQTLDQQITYIQREIDRKQKDIQAGFEASDRSGLKESYIFQRLMELETQEKTLAQKAKMLTAIITERTASFKALATRLEEYTGLLRKQKVEEQIHGQLLEKLNQAEVDRGAMNMAFKVLAPPTTPTAPIRPRFALNMIFAFIVGIIIAFLMVQWQETMDSSFRTPEEAQKATGLPTLGLIPDFKPLLALEYDKNVEISPAIITFHQRTSPESEAFRALRATLQHMNKNKPFRTLLLTSWGAEMGKSTLTANLAMAYAQMGVKTLLIDGDLRRPVLHNMFFQTNHRGLSDYVLGEPLERVLLPTHQPNLWFLPTGALPPNPSEFLGSPEMLGKFEELKNKFEIVLVDAPPIGLVSDVMVFAHRIDAMVYLVPLGKENLKLTLKGLEMLKLVEAPVVGIVCNFVKYYETTDYYSRHRKYGR